MIFADLSSCRVRTKGFAADSLNSPAHVFAVRICGVVAAMRGCCKSLELRAVNSGTTGYVSWSGLQDERSLISIEHVTAASKCILIQNGGD